MVLYTTRPIRDGEEEGKQYFFTDEEKLKEMLKFANAAASLVTTKKGALRVMPTKEEVETFIENFKR